MERKFTDSASKPARCEKCSSLILKSERGEFCHCMNDL